MTKRYRPLVRSDAPRPEDAQPLAAGPRWFTHCALHQPGQPPQRVPARDVPPEVLARLTAPRPALAGLSLEAPRIMGILNVTPDSFSDGGLDASATEAAARGRALLAAGADLLDIGAESTRPGAAEVPQAEELARLLPVLEALPGAPVSVDTRKAAVARAAARAGAALINDVSGLCFDPDMARSVAELGLPVCIMHSRGTPETMRELTSYEDVLLEVYEFLETQLALLENLGLPRGQVLVDPGIGFAKTEAQNLALLRGLSIFHGLGCGLLVGVSRKGFVGRIGGAPRPADRAPGSLALALAAVAQGAQVIRVHDVAETSQALALWQAVEHEGEKP